MPSHKRGRPPLKDERMRRHQVVLDWETVQVAKSLGRGNLSAGIRELAITTNQEESGMYDTIWIWIGNKDFGFWRHTSGYSESRLQVFTDAGILAYPGRDNLGPPFNTPPAEDFK